MATRISTRTGRRVLRAAASVVVLLGLGLLCAAPAEAHATLISSTPAAGARIAKLPTKVTFTFDENVAQPAFVVVTAPDGTNLADGQAQVLNATITQPIKPVNEKGTYAMSYRVVSGDGHTITNTVPVIVTRGKTVAQRAQGSTNGPSASTSGSVWARHSASVVSAMVLIVVAACLWLLVWPIRRTESQGKLRG